MTWKQQFIKFLKDNNLYESYIFNFNNDFEYRLIYNLPNNGAKAFFENTSHEYYILRAFEWDSTREGHLFWDKIDKKWYIYLQDIERKLKTGNNSKKL